LTAGSHAGQGAQSRYTSLSHNQPLTSILVIIYLPINNIYEAVSMILV